jgi:NTE family protein
MGISIVQKSNLNQKKVNPKIALVLAGGAISGGAFKIGGLKALNDFLVNRKLTDFDLYLGLSAGAFLAVPLAGGISPEEMLASLDGKSKKYSQLSPLDLYAPNYMEFISRPLKYWYGHASYLPGVMFDLVRAIPRLRHDLVGHVLTFFREPSYSNYEQLTKPFMKVAFSTRSMPSLGELLPSGIFHNNNLETYLRGNMRRNKMPNNFRVLKKMTGKSLYIAAMDLDTSDRVIFGPDEKNDISISEATQASSAIPGFYKPARIKGVDYIDGGVRKTANIDLAFEKGADLAICYNPFRPYNNKIFLEYLREENKYITRNKRLSDWGLGTVLNQVFRTLFHSRLQTGLENLRNDPNFKKDIILIEPTEDDNDFFTMNPLFFWNRAKAAKLGFDSTCSSIQRHYDKIAPILASYGLQMTTDVINEDLNTIKRSTYDDDTIMDVLEQDRPSSKPLKVLKGGRSA